MKRMPLATRLLVPVSLAVTLAPPAVVAACGSEEPTVWGEAGH